MDTNDRHSEYLGCVVRMVSISSFDDRRHQGPTRVQDHHGFGCVLHRAFPLVNRAHLGVNVAARGQASLNKTTREFCQPVGTFSTNRDRGKFNVHPFTLPTGQRDPELDRRLYDLADHVLVPTIAPKATTTRPVMGLTYPRHRGPSVRVGAGRSRWFPLTWSHHP
jgi:hypothetical protein